MPNLEQGVTIHRLAVNSITVEHKPLVSILIPVFNRQVLVIDSIISALQQDYPNIEIVISDNCSSDTTLSTVMDFTSDHKNVTVISQACNIGPVANWKSCLDYSKGSLIKFLFSDDVLEKHCVSRMVPLLAKEDVAYVYSSCRIGLERESSMIFYADNSKGGVDNRARTYSVHRAYFRYSLALPMPVSPCCGLFRRRTVIDSLNESLSNPVSPLNLIYGAGPDIKIFFDALVNHRQYSHIPEPLVFFRSHRFSFTLNNNKEVKQAYQIALSKYRKTFPIYAQLLFSISEIIKKIGLIPLYFFRCYI